MILALTASVAIVVLDHASLRAAPRSSAAELTALWQGDVLEVRGERAGYLQVYDYRRERGGYLRSESVRQVELTETGAPELLSVLRFLRESPGSEALGISRVAGVAARLEVVQQFGIHMRTFERDGRMRVCYDGELFRGVLTLAGASAEERARAVLGLTRPDCIDPDQGPVPRASLDDERSALLDQIDEQNLSAMTRSRIHARRAEVWASIAFEQARRREPPQAAAERALTELIAVHTNDLGDDHRAEYIDAVLRVGAIRWAPMKPAPQAGPLTLSAAPGAPGQTCVALEDARRRVPAPLVQRCTYGIVWMASAQAIPQGPALVLAVQPMESWRELWVFHERSGIWTADVLSPGADDPEEGYVEFAGFAPGTKRLLIAREVKNRGRFQRRFEELRLDDLALAHEAGSPDMLRDFGRWQDVAWRRDTLSLH